MKRIGMRCAIGFVGPLLAAALLLGGRVHGDLSPFALMGGGLISVAITLNLFIIGLFCGFKSRFRVGHVFDDVIQSLSRGFLALLSCVYAAVLVVADVWLQEVSVFQNWLTAMTGALALLLRVAAFVFVVMLGVMLARISTVSVRGAFLCFLSGGGIFAAMMLDVLSSVVVEQVRLGWTLMGAYWIRYFVCFLGVSALVLFMAVGILVIISNGTMKRGRCAT